MAEEFPIFLAQLELGEDPAAKPPPPQTRSSRPMTFSDLQGAMHDYNTGKNVDHTFRNGSLLILAAIAVVALAIHLRQKQKEAAPPESPAKLGRELARAVRFPLGTKWLLRWVAASRKVPFGALLLSSALFDRCVKEWSREETFGLLRTWGKSRLARLRPVLFES